LAGCGVQFKLVHQPLGAGQAQAQAAAGGPAVGHRQLEVGDARPFVAKGQAQAWAVVFFDHGPIHMAAAAVHHGVARQLTDGGDQLGQVDQAHAAFLGQLAHQLSGQHYVLFDEHRVSATAGLGHE